METMKIKTRRSVGFLVTQSICDYEKSDETGCLVMKEAPVWLHMGWADIPTERWALKTPTGRGITLGKNGDEIVAIDEDGTIIEDIVVSGVSASSFEDSPIDPRD